MNEKHRLDKFLATNTEYSRKEIKKILRTGNVTVDGEIIKDGSKQVSNHQCISFYGQVIHARSLRYFMLNKPADVVSATVDTEHMTALDLLEEPFYEELHIAGRLDIDSTGLLLITDDGQWTQRITSPKRKLPKTYWVETARPIESSYIAAMSKGILLRSEDTPTSPAQLEILDERHARLTITEGRYHQVRRMFAALGNYVDALHRESIGPIHLDSELELGEYRALTSEELNTINKHIGLI